MRGEPAGRSRRLSSSFFFPCFRSSARLRRRSVTPAKPPAAAIASHQAGAQKFRRDARGLAGRRIGDDAAAIFVRRDREMPTAPSASIARARRARPRPGALRPQRAYNSGASMPRSRTFVVMSIPGQNSPAPRRCRRRSPAAPPPDECRRGRGGAAIAGGRRWATGDRSRRRPPLHRGPIRPPAAQPAATVAAIPIPRRFGI